MSPEQDEPSGHRGESEEREEPALRVLYQDESCVVVDKPSGVIVHRGWANDDRDLLRMTRDALGRYVYPLHRLDRGASGAVLFALDEHAARTLNRGFAEGGMGKRYLALTRGHPPEHGLIDHPVPRAPGEERVPAQTEFARLGTFERYALVAGAAQDRAAASDPSSLEAPLVSADWRREVWQGRAQPLVP